MLRLFILLSIIYGATSEQLQSPLSENIIGGTDAKISLFPWQVSVQENSRHSCGGSIYSKNIIITAAHCIHNIPKKILSIRAGSALWKSGGVVRDVANYSIHPRYDSVDQLYDIAVIRLKKALTLSSTIKAIRLASVSPLNGARAAISGWGNNKYGSKALSSYLQYANTTVIDTQSCRSKKYGYKKEIHLTMICAASPGKDACESDSGGPMISGGVLAGVISWGEACADQYYPGVYANVAVLKSWIEKAAQNT